MQTDLVRDLVEGEMADVALTYRPVESVTEESAFMPALGKLGNSCKSCHQDYRRPKN